MLTILASPSSGTASINGYRIIHDSGKIKKEIGMVPQYMNLDQELTARENLELPGRLHKMPRLQRQQRIQELLAYVELTGRAHDLTDKFSEGVIN